MRRSPRKFLFLLPLTLALLASADESDTKVMLQEIKDMTKFAESYTGISELDDSVYASMNRVDRAVFVPPNTQQSAYENRALSIGYGQTISQPFIVALMTHLLDVKPADKVLEIGTGSGYQAAILGELASEVYTIEIVPELARTATERIKKIGYENINIKAGDGWFGWEEASPFDKIIVTAVAAEVPPRLVEQLKPNGLLTMPLGSHTGFQELVLVRKISDTELDITKILSVQFVPMTGKAIEEAKSDR